MSDAVLAACAATETPQGVLAVVPVPRVAPREGLILVVDDIEAAHAHLVERGVASTPIRNFTDGEWREGKGGDWNSFVHFSDPDGNGWAVQELPPRP